MEVEEQIKPSSDGRLTFTYSGGRADSNALLLNEYAASLDGWQELLQILGEVYFHSFPELRQIRGNDLLRIEVTTERPGSYETVLLFIFGAVASGILGNRADAAIVWSFKKLLTWYKRAIGEYVRTKSQTTDITKLASALKSTAIEEGLSLETPFDPPPPDLVLFPPVPDTTLEPEEPSPSIVGHIERPRILAETMDKALVQATQPLENSCERLIVSETTRAVLLEFGAAERAVIKTPPTLPPLSRKWSESRIKFVRINRKTGRALFRFDHEADDARVAHYSRIIDPAVQKPHNSYTEAFNADSILSVWMRQASPERGNLNFQWEVTVHDPNEGCLFKMDHES
jgi:hypothetical protein